MKKFIILTIVLFASQAWSAPFLVCDPQAGVVGYEITGLGETVSYIAQPDGSIKYDLASVNSDTYTLTVAACNMWGCSSTAPFGFSKQVPSAPAGLRIVAD
jgi:hypothetical protein